MNKFFENRKNNGAIDQRIKELLIVVNDELNTCNPEDVVFYEIYKKYCQYLLKRYKYLKYLPGKVVDLLVEKEKFLDILIDRLDYNNDYIILKNLSLKINASSYEKNILTGAILDSLTQHLLSLDISKEYMIYNFLPEGPYEFKNVRLAKGDTVIDAGANSGEFSLLSAYKGCRTYAFEPSNYVIEKYLKPVIKLNKELSENIIVAPYALCDKKGWSKFSMPSTNMAGGTIRDSANEDERSEKVELISLDEYVDENNIQRVDFIKADIEGSERDMLKGAKRILKDFGPNLALCTYHLKDDPEVMEELIMQANTNYVIEHKYKKMYAYIPK